MSNLKISQLTATTSNSIGSYLVVNNSGETVTNKSQLQYVLGMTKGSGTNSIKSNDFLTANPSVADTDSSIALGNGASAFTANEIIAIGKGAKAESVGVIAIGTGAKDQGPGRDYGIAIGYGAEAYQLNSIAFGKDAGAVQDAFAIGNTARAIGTSTIAIGNNSVVAGLYGTGIGGEIFSDRNYNTTIGYDAYSSGIGSVALGPLNVLGQSGGDSEYTNVFGYSNVVSNGAGSATIIGREITNRSNGTIAITNEQVDLGTDSPNTVFIMGTGHTVNTRVGRSGVYIGGFSQTITNPGPGSFNYGGSGNTISSTSDNAGIFHSVDSETYAHARLSGIYGSRNSYISGTTASTYSTWGSGIYSSNEGDIRNAQFSTIVGGSANSIQESGAVSIIGSGQSVIKGLAGEALIGGSGQSTIDGNNNINNVKNVILASDDAVLFDTDICAIIGGDNNAISGGSLNFIVGGRNSIMENDCFNSDIIGSDESRINASDFSMILNSKDCLISGATFERSALINSSGSSINTESNQIGIGLIGRTPTFSNTTSVENVHYYRRISTEVQPMVSGVTFTGADAIDWNDGGKAQITITGASNVEFTNVINGGSFLLKTTTDGGHTITWSSTGFTFKWKGGDSTPSNNKTDLWRFEVFGTVIFGEKIADFT